MPISTTLVSSSDTTKLLEKIENDFGETSDRWIIPNGRPAIALAVLDSIYSTGNHYTGVKRLVQRYSELRKDEDGDATTDGAADLVRAFDRWGGVEGFVVKTDPELDLLELE